MKAKLQISLLLSLATTLNVFAQYFGEQQVISTFADGAKSVYATDLDGNGGKDVLVVHSAKINWYRNVEGTGFVEQPSIAWSFGGNLSAYAADLDGDGDQDVLSSFSQDNKIAWHENTDGNGSFGPKQDISNSVVKACSVYAADIDGDGDQDVLSVSTDYPVPNHGKIYWHKNTDGNGTFGAKQVITTTLHGPRSVYATDLDGDGDQDVLSVFHELNGSSINWYENIDGNGTFGAQQSITTSVHGAKSVYTSDIDGDGDQDVLSASYFDDKIAWYENIDGSGTFGPQQVITTAAEGAYSVYATDLDGDDDQDVLSASFNDNKIAWYENTDGNGTFGPLQVITTSADGAKSVHAADLDRDGDQDVLSASYNDDKIAWYENSGTIGVAENNLIEFSIYPNPTTGILCIQSQQSILKIEAYDSLGRFIAFKANNNRINISKLNRGIYFIKIFVENGDFGNTRIIKN